MTHTERNLDNCIINIILNLFFPSKQVTDNTACWSFKEGDAGTTFPNDTAASKSILVYDALSMEADKTYLFTLVITKGSRSSSAEVSVIALDGDPPRVSTLTFKCRIIYQWYEFGVMNFMACFTNLTLANLQSRYYLFLRIYHILNNKNVRIHYRIIIMNIIPIHVRSRRFSLVYSCLLN